MRRPSRVAALALALAGALCACTGPAAKLDQANGLRHAGRPREALALYREVLSDLGDRKLPAEDAEVRLRALQYAGDVSYLELGDFQGAVAYYRRLIALSPGTADAWHARSVIGDIYRDRFGDRMGAIAQWAEIAAGADPSAPQYQLKVAREYLELKNYEQARTEARILRDRWPRSPEADEAQLLTGQAWAVERRADEAVRAFQVAVERRPRSELAARALEGQAQIYAQMGPGEKCGRETCLDRAIALYAEALPTHPNPDALRMNIEAVRRRQEAARPVKPGDRAAAMDQHTQQPKEKVIP